MPTQFPSYRNRFYFPKCQHYYCGHSLGLQPKTSARYVQIEMEDWRNMAVNAHLSGRNPWMFYQNRSKKGLAHLAGALESEVVAMNSLTTNLHLLFASFYRPKGKRTKIITEWGSFPSDQFLLESQIAFHGLDPVKHLIKIKPDKTTDLYQEHDILAAMDQAGDELALVFFSGINWITGQLYDISLITQKAHEIGAYAGFDLAHAMGNVPLQLHDNQVDFAAWCSYKFMNSGPGAVGGIFVHEKNPFINFPGFQGWWGQNYNTRFQSEMAFSPMLGSDAWQLSNVNILSNAVLQSSLDIFLEADINSLHKKSMALTSKLEYGLKTLHSFGTKFTLITPSDPKRRGATLALKIHDGERELVSKIAQQGCIVDFRSPNIMRISLAPLYTDESDIDALINSLKLIW